MCAGFWLASAAVIQNQAHLKYHCYLQFLTSEFHNFIYFRLKPLHNIGKIGILMYKALPRQGPPNQIDSTQLNSSHLSTHGIPDASERPSRSSSTTLFHRTSVSTPAIFGDRFYIQSPQPTPDWGISSILSQPPSHLPVLVNNWFSSVSTHSSPPHSKDPSPTRLHISTH